MKITIAIPTHNMLSKTFFLRRSLDAIAEQTFRDFEVVITDNSDDDILETVLEEYTDLDICYLKNPIKGMAQNSNETIKCSKGDLIKVLYLDDYLAHKNALKTIVEAFDPIDNWLVTGCTHNSHMDLRHGPHYAQFSPNDMDNFIGSPSVLTIRKGLNVFFDENLTWLLDLDLYKRLYKQYGNPKIVDDLNVVIGLGKHQMTNILSDDLKLKEKQYIINKKI